MKAFHGDPQIKAEILSQLKSQSTSSHDFGTASCRTKRRATNYAHNRTGKLFTLVGTHLPDTLVRLATDLELSYLSLYSREKWNYEFIDAITPGAELKNSWRKYSQWRLTNALSSGKLHWLSTRQFAIVENVANLLSQHVDDLQAWRQALKQTAYAILAIDLTDRQRHGLGQTEWHTSASILQSLVEEMSDAEAAEKLADIASGTAHLAYAIVDPYWKDNMFFVDMHANKLLDIVRAEP